MAAKNTSTGVDQNLASLLCYLGFIVTGLVFLLLEKKNKTVRFHAAQSVWLSVFIIIAHVVLAIIPIIGWLLMPLLGLIVVILWIFLMIKAYQGEKYELAIVADLAKKTV